MPLVKTTLVPSGERRGLAAPALVMALREGTEGKRVAAARVTISASTLRVLVQEKNRLFNFYPVGSGGKLRVVLVAEES